MGDKKHPRPNSPNELLLQPRARTLRRLSRSVSWTLTRSGLVKNESLNWFLRAGWSLGGGDDGDVAGDAWWLTARWFFRIFRDPFDFDHFLRLFFVHPVLEDAGSSTTAPGEKASAFPVSDWIFWSGSFGWTLQLRACAGFLVATAINFEPVFQPPSLLCSQPSSIFFHLDSRPTNCYVSSVCLPVSAPDPSRSYLFKYIRESKHATSNRKLLHMDAG